MHTTFNVFPYLITLLIATCEGTTVQLYCTQLEYSQVGVIWKMLFCWCCIFVAFTFHTSASLPPYPLNCRILRLHILFVWYALAGNRTKTSRYYTLQPGHYTHYAIPATIISKLVLRVSGSYNRKGFAWNCIHFNTNLIPRLQLLISNLSASER